MPNQEHFIISQIKNIGDVILCLPLASLLKQAIPSCKITLLAQAYTFPIANNCPDIDSVIDWLTLEKKDSNTIIRTLQLCKASAIIHLANNKKIAKYAFQAGIKQRVGTSQRLYHWLYCNKTINQARRHSTLHELQLNAQMLKPLNIAGIEPDQHKETLINYMNLEVPAIPLPPIITTQLSKYQKKIILHPGSNGHGREWPIEHYISLANHLYEKGAQVIFTGSKSEALKFESLALQCPFAINSFGHLTIDELMVLINQADIFVGAGTGPTHIAAALNKPTIGLFPPRKGISPRRWKPPGRKVTTLMYKRKKPCFSCRENEGCLCMKKITVQEVSAVIEKIFEAVS